MHKCVFADVNTYLPWQGPGWDYESVAKNPRAFWSKAADAPMYLRKHPIWAAPAPSTDPRLVAWCDAEPALLRSGAQKVEKHCRCQEGTSGALCAETQLHACLNQCNGHGECSYGYCKCDHGWYGVDCSLRAGGLAVEHPTPSALPTHQPGRSFSHLPFVTDAATTPTTPPDGCRRAENVPYPAIYLYELPIEFNLQLWTAKSKDEDCALRSYTSRNTTGKLALPTRACHARTR